MSGLILPNKKKQCIEEWRHFVRDFLTHRTKLSIEGTRANMTLNMAIIQGCSYIGLSQTGGSGDNVMIVRYEGSIRSDGSKARRQLPSVPLW